VTPLDLLSVKGSLPIYGRSGFQRAVADLAPDDGFFVQYRMLEGLGHAIKDRLRVHALAPRLVVLPRVSEAGATVVLAGARNPGVVSDLKEQASKLGMDFDCSSLGKGIPERISLSGDPSRLKILMSEMKKFPLEIADDLTIPDAWRLLASIQSLRERVRAITSNMTGLATGEPPEDAEVFNPATGYYDAWHDLSGDYQAHFILWKYKAYQYRLFWWQEDLESEKVGRWKQWQSAAGDPLWLRWAVACSANPHGAPPGISVDGFYKVCKVTPLPMELHRVCCLCSGFPPEKDADHFIYRDVPPVIQQGVNDRLVVECP
jgi:hypothetical protein